MNRKKIVVWVSITSLLLIGLAVSGCLEREDPTVATVQVYLDAKNTSDYDTASRVVDSRYQSKGYLMMTWTRVEQTKNKKIHNVSMTAAISGNRAVVAANYTEIEYDENAHKKIGEQNMTQYFKLENIDGMWLITGISSEPLSQPESTGPVKKDPLDQLNDNAVYILPAALLMLVVGVTLNRKEKAKANGSAQGSGGSNPNTLPLQTAQLSRFVRCMPSQMSAGNPGTIDVWIKNFGKQPYTKLVVTAAFPDNVKVKKNKLKFSTLEAGQTAKQTWKVKPAASGKFQIDNVAVAFTFGGKKYAGALDPVWVQVA